MSVIYIFIKEPDDDKQVKIDVCTDYQTELELLNDELKRVGDTKNHFEAFAIFDLKDMDMNSQKLKNVLHGILTTRQYNGLADTYYAIKAEDAFNKLSALFDFNSSVVESSLLGGSNQTFTSQKSNKPVSKAKRTHISSKPRNNDNEFINKSPKDKDKALDLLSESGFNIETDNVTYASITNGTNYYWANPQVHCLDSDWYFVLNDIRNLRLYVFLIPSKSIALRQFKTRIKRSVLCLQLQIKYGDPDFTDEPSKIAFAPFKVYELRYAREDIENTIVNKKLSELSSVNTKSVKINSYIYQNKTIPVRSIKDMLRKILDMIFCEKPDSLYSIANAHYSPFGGEKVYVTCDANTKNKYNSPYEILTSGIYVETCLNHKQSFELIISILKACGYTISDFSVNLKCSV